MSLGDKIGYTFENKSLLDEALTHPSCAKVKKGFAYNNQRLEFLGDSVLGLLVAELLFDRYPKENEGSLAKRQAALVRSETLARVARSIHLGVYVKIKGAEQDNGHDLDSNLEDACEALIGALYLDGGFDTARRFVRAHWEALAREQAAPPKDAKTTLQEWAQSRGLSLPEYRLLSATGPAHAPEFTLSVSVAGDMLETAKAPSKRQAEQLAAKALLARLETT